MVIAKNLSTFAYLKTSVHFLLKQMILKYFVRTSLLIMSVLAFTSCLNNDQNQVADLSKDAQIYSFAMSSRADTAKAFVESPFTIDQIGNRIFNKNPLPYLFDADSVKLSITGVPSYYRESLSQIKLILQNTDSSYVWNRTDSVSLKRLKQIETTAADGITTKLYDFQLNVYQEDPDILNWQKLKENYLTSLPIDAQKTISFSNRFITYYKSGTSIKAMSSTDGISWTTAAITGLPATLKLTSIIAVDKAIFALNQTNALYKTTDGVNWSPMTTTYPIVAIYGKLPSATNGNILAVVNKNDVLTFAETNDFVTLKLMNTVPAGLPLNNFSATQVDNPAVYSAKYILISGGVTATNQPNNSIWLVQEKNGNITNINKPMSFSLAGSTVFNYNNNQYMITAQSGKNVLLFSEDYGLTWKTAGTNQAFPADFNFRTNASVITDSNNYIWIFGGTSGTLTQLVDVWRGRLNILGQ